MFRTGRAGGRINDLSEIRVSERKHNDFTRHFWKETEKIFSRLSDKKRREIREGEMAGVGYDQNERPSILWEEQNGVRVMISRSPNRTFDLRMWSPEKGEFVHEKNKSWKGIERFL